MIRLNRTTKVAGTPATPGRTGAEKVRAVAMARGSTPKRAVVIGFLAAAMIVSMSALAGAHGGDAGKVHACVVSSSGTLRIVGAGESCRNGETPLDWSVGGNGIGAGTIRGELNPAPHAVRAEATGDIALGTVSGQGDNDDGDLAFGADNTYISGNLGLHTVGRRNLVNGAVDSDKIAYYAISSVHLDPTLQQVLGALQQKVAALETEVAALRAR